MTSDLPIPRLADILDRALDIRASAVRLSDDASIRQLDRLIGKLYDGTRLCWVLGVLHISSPSGRAYHVSQAGCDCPNGTKSRARACWHVALHGLLLDMFATQVATADMEAECPRAVEARIVAARSLVWTRL
jgi:hypothetical protein